MALTVAEVRTQITKILDLIETTRIAADGLWTDSAEYDDLVAELEGEYIPSSVTASLASYRADLSNLVTGARVLEFLTPCLFDYAKLLTEGAGYSNVNDIMRALYEVPVTVESRALTYAAASAGGSNVGNGLLSRLTKDDMDYDLEATTVETKYLRCRSDQNTGTNEFAESFECIGIASSQDALLNKTSGSSPRYGSGEAGRAFIRNHHAGSAEGGSLLRNSSFSTYSATATPKFLGWDLVSGTVPSQSTTAAEIYISHPNASTDASMKFTATGRVKQTLDNMRISRIDHNTPYFFRVMAKRGAGTAVGGSLKIHLGSTVRTVAVSSLHATEWTEVVIPFDKTCWPKEFNQDALDVDIEWYDAGSGYLIVDDAILAPWDLIDGTYYFLRHEDNAPVSWLVDDKFTVATTQSDIAKGIVQYWLWKAGLGYLKPVTSSPDIGNPV